MRNSRPGEKATRPVSTPLLFAYAILLVVALFSLITRDPLLLIVDCQPWGTAIAAAALGIGAGLLRLPVFGGVGRRWQLIGGAGLGLGVLSLMTLLLGLAGALRPVVAQAIVCAGVLLAFYSAWRHRRRADGPMGQAGTADATIGERFSIVPAAEQLRESARRGQWLWAMFVPAAALALAAATIPPGMSWVEEGNGYDVLEYHLGAPREYFEAGRITFLPHNVYSNMPLGVEMLYLLTMHVTGDAVKAVMPAQFLNAMLGLLAAGAVWLAATEAAGPFCEPRAQPGAPLVEGVSPRNRAGGWKAAHIAGVVFGTCPFIVYLSGVAYVENGQLLFAALALAAFLRGRRVGECAAEMQLPESPGGSTGSTAPGRTTSAGAYHWMLLAGLFAGLACGCKYTGVVMTALPIGLALLFDLARRRARPIALVAFAAGATLTFGPWLAKNWAWTGNPVFPLAAGVFGWNEGAWDADSAARWEAGHRPAAEHRALGARLRRLGEQVYALPEAEAERMGTRRESTGSRAAEPPPASRPWLPRFGLVAAVGTIAGAASAIMAAAGARRRRRMRTSPSAAHGAPPPALDVCWLIVACGLAAWLAASHLVDRFAVLLLPAFALMIGDAWRRLPETIRPAGTVLAALVALLGVIISARIVLANPIPYREASLFGRTAWMTRGEWLRSAHIPRLNALLSGGRRILMVGEARHFYLNPGADYCVVFNANPFAEAAKRLGPAELNAWLRERGYDYVYVDWGEMGRLRRTYGFWESISEGLFAGMASAGLRPVEEFSIELDGRRVPYATLFQAPGG